MGAGAAAGICAATQSASDEELRATFSQLAPAQRQKLLQALAAVGGAQVAAGSIFDWPPLESNPEVFTTYMQKVGLSANFAIAEVFGFDEELLGFLAQPIFGVIVNYERLKKQEDKARGSIDNLGLVDWYMKQSGTLDNACGIIAAIHCVFNSPVEVVPDSILGAFADTTRSHTPEERCIALETNNAFKEQHSGAAAQGQTDAVLSDQSKVRHHFVAFVVKEGKLIELDGTKQGPNVISDSDDVLRGTILEIQRRLADGEISDQLSMIVLNAAG